VSRERALGYNGRGRWESGSGGKKARKRHLLCHEQTATETPSARRRVPPNAAAAKVFNIRLVQFIGFPQGGNFQ